MGRNSIDNGHEDVEHAVSGMHTCCALARALARALSLTLKIVNIKYKHDF